VENRIDLFCREGFAKKNVKTGVADASTPMRIQDTLRHDDVFGKGERQERIFSELSMEGEYHAAY